jgi:hypothetical protein
VFDSLSPHNRRAVLRFILCNPYIRGGKTFAEVVSRIVGEPVKVDTARYLRYDAYRYAGLESPRRGPSPLVVPAGQHEILQNAVGVAYRDDRLRSEPRTSAVAILPTGDVVFLGHPSDPPEGLGLRGYFTPEGFVSEDSAGEDAGAGEEAMSAPLEPEEEPAVEEPAVEETEANGTALVTVDALMPLLIRAMREEGYRSVSVNDDGVEPTYSYSGRSAVTL